MPVMPKHAERTPRVPTKPIAPKATAKKPPTNAKPFVTAKTAAAPKEPKLRIPDIAIPKGFKIPKTLAECADELYDRRTSRLAMQKEVDAEQKIETFLTEYIIHNLPKTQDVVGGKKATVTRFKKEILQVTDWEALYKYIKRTGFWSLLQKRLGEAMAKELMEAKKDVPGVSKFPRSVLSVTKRPGAK
jgi:hypothetical protein